MDFAGYHDQDQYTAVHWHEFVVIRPLAIQVSGLAHKFKSLTMCENQLVLVTSASQIVFREREHAVLRTCDEVVHELFGPPILHVVEYPAQINHSGKVFTYVSSALGDRAALGTHRYVMDWMGLIAPDNKQDGASPLVKDTMKHPHQVSHERTASVHCGKAVRHRVQSVAQFCA